jgi:hypothetical protein
LKNNYKNENRAGGEEEACPQYLYSAANMVIRFQKKYISI